MAKITTETNLDTREEKLLEREQKVSSKEQNIRELQSRLQRSQNENDQKEKELNNRESDIAIEKTKLISEKRVELQGLEKDISNANLELNQVKKNTEVAKATQQSVINKYSLDQMADIETAVTNRIKKENEELLKDYAKKINELTSGIKWAKDELDNAFASLLDNYKDSLETKKSLYDEKLADVQKASEHFEEEISKASNVLEREADIQLQEKKLDLQKKQLDKVVDKRVEEKYRDLLSEKSRIEADINSLNETVKDLRDKNRELNKIIQGTEFIDKIQSEADLNDLRIKYQDIARRLKEYSSEELEEIKAKASKHDELVELLKQKTLECDEANRKYNNIKNERDDVTSLKFINEGLECRIKTERDTLVALKSDIEALEARLDNTNASNLACASVEKHLEEFENCSSCTNVNILENEWLDKISKDCDISGYKFPRRLFYSFHTSLIASDMSPLTVLAGVSGTGKSKLPQLYSRFGGLYFLSVPIQPDYDSPQSLFGYFNSIEKRFNPTNLTQALVSFQKDKSVSPTKDNILDLSDKVLLVLLDEMNLAHIELYFSDLLSKLEERRDGNDNVCELLDMGAKNKKYRIALTDNVKWIGTMNEDETTKSLSDKVIDRGNIISFPRPDSFEPYMNRKNHPMEPEHDKISKVQWDKWVTSKIELTTEERNAYMQIVKEINNALATANRAIGHRVWQSIENYMISHPLVKKYKDDINDINKRKIALDYAFEEAVVYKIMPKLRGVETTGDQRVNCLDAILNIMKQYNFKTIIPDYEKGLDSVTRTFNWCSSNYLNDDYKMED